MRPRALSGGLGLNPPWERDPQTEPGQAMGASTGGSGTARRCHRRSASAPARGKAALARRHTRREPSGHVPACPPLRRRRCFIQKRGENSSAAAAGPPSPPASRGNSRHTRRTWEGAGFSLPGGRVAALCRIARTPRPVLASPGTPEPKEPREPRHGGAPPARTGVTGR